MSDYNKKLEKMATEQLASRLQVNLIRVEPHIGYPGLQFQLPKELELLRLNNRKKADAVQEFTREALRAASLSLFPQETLNLQSKAGQLRTLCKKYYLADKYVNACFVPEIQEKAKPIIAEFNQQVDDICDRWEPEVKRFRSNLRDWLKAIRMTEEKRSIFFHIMSGSIPTKEQFRSSCHIRVDYKAVPSLTTVPQFSDDINELIADGWREEMLELGKSAVNKCLNDAYNTANSTLRTCLNGREPNQMTRNAMANLAHSLKVNNLFSNELIRDCANTYERVIAMKMYGEDLEDQKALKSVPICTNVCGTKSISEFARTTQRVEQLPSSPTMQKW